MNFQEIQIWALLAGLGLFRFGMFMMEEALRSLAGRSFKKFLRKQTGNPAKAVISGALVTAVLQSSTMVSLLVMSFAGAGIIGLKNGIGMILGANLGSTATGWLVSLIGFKLNIGDAILPFLATGGLGILFLKSEKLINICKVIMGFSLMFLGLNYMKGGFETFAAHIDFSFLANKSPLLFLIFGMLLAASIQSSAAAIMIFLSSLAAGVITFDKALYLVIGADLGTTITAIISTINANSIKKKVGWSQFIFNVFTTCMTLVLMKFYLYIINDVLKISDPLIALVTFHSILNLAGIIFMFPFLKQFTLLIDKYIAGREVSLAKNIILVNPAESHAALEALNKEINEFLECAITVLHNFFHLPYSNGRQGNPFTYTELKNYENEIVNFYIKVQQTSLNEDEVSKINRVIASIRNATLSAKDIKDIKHNLDELYNSPHDDLYAFYQTVRENQKLFYNEIQEMIRNPAILKLEELTRLKELHKSFYQSESQGIYRLFTEKKHHEVVIPNLLNMIREINESNEAIIRSLNYLTTAAD